MTNGPLPAGRKFCKTTQNRPKKERDWPGKLALVRPPFYDKRGRKPAEKKYFMKTKHGYMLENLPL
jgi:hypothetical protein